MKKKLLITGHIPEYLISPYREKFDITMPDEKKDRYTQEEVESLIQGQDAIFTLYAFKFQKELIEIAKDIKVVANGGVGYDNIDVECCTEHGIYVVNTPTTVTEPTAEMTFAIMMAITKGVVLYDKAARTNGSTVFPFSLTGTFCFMERHWGLSDMGGLGRHWQERRWGLA